MIGIQPTLMPEDLTGGWMSPSLRYQALNDSIFTARGEDILIDITGAEQGKHGFIAITTETAYLGDSVPKKNQALGFILVQHEELVGNKSNASMLIEKSLTLLIAKKGK
jgi:hypothetical protein